MFGWLAKFKLNLVFYLEHFIPPPLPVFSVVWQLVENADTGEWPQSDLNVCAADQCTADGFGTTLGRYILSFGEDQQGMCI